ncbi:MAG: DUF2304 domain-containing protein [Candidatus Moranbacteria bacterium]|jgi:hypothetical protein|nr:DUF2304 domain-containing protein [Candidatus Moranbacteria bacterium]MBP9801699.1 DUF2304 domain-containing protein [Candidatus Moranbacteria bacterium]
MEFKLYQVVITLIAIFMIYQGGKDYFRGGNNQTFIKFFVRVLVWGGMTAIVIFPHLTNFAATVIGIQDNVNAAILAGFILTFLMIFKLLSAIERLEQQITTLTRTETLQKLNLKKSK